MKRVQYHRGTPLPPGARLVARPSRWGNPYPVAVYGKHTSIAMYRRYAAFQLEIDPTWLDPLRGHDLACYCSLDVPCHADVLRELLA